MYQIHRQDILEWAREYDGPPFHAALLDPPYHLTSITKRFSKPGSKPPKGGVYKRTSAGFMLSEWDGLGESGKGIAFDPATWAALSQHLYPGAFIMAFGGSRGYHRMATAMEDAGLIIHPAMGWLTLSGFPKATQISSQIDKAAKTEGAYSEGADGKDSPTVSTYNKGLNVNFEARRQYQPATPLARDWAGHRYGLQALKPAFEFIAVAQVPYEGRPVDSIVATGAGSLWIDGGRIAAQDLTPRDNKVGQNGWKNSSGGYIEPHPAGRWPANFLLTCCCDPARTDPAHQDNCPVRLFDEQAGESSSGEHLPGQTRGDIENQPVGFKGLKNNVNYYPADSGPASRMFHQATWQYEVAEQLAGAEPVRYEPKVSSSEREAGLDELETITRHRMRPDADPEKLTGLNTEPRFAPTQVKNNHPTLKPISLTKYLATLLLPPAAYAPRRILVPFAGTGSEMAGAILAGWEEVVGIEREAGYVKIAEARLRWWSQWPGWGQTDVEAILAAAGKEDAGQMSLFGEAE